MKKSNEMNLSNGSRRRKHMKLTWKRKERNMISKESTIGKSKRSCRSYKRRIKTRKIN